MASSVVLQIFRFTNTPSEMLPVFEEKLISNLCDVTSPIYQEMEQNFHDRFMVELGNRVHDFKALSGVGLFYVATGGRVQTTGHSGRDREGNASLNDSHEERSIEDIATRLAHLGILHWRVWGKLAYADDIDQMSLDISSSVASSMLEVDSHHPSNVLTKDLIPNRSSISALHKRATSQVLGQVQMSAKQPVCRGETGRKRKGGLISKRSMPALKKSSLSNPPVQQTSQLERFNSMERNLGIVSTEIMIPKNTPNTVVKASGKEIRSEKATYELSSKAYGLGSKAPLQPRRSARIAARKPRIS
jgi:hypothetical protein